MLLSHEVRPGLKPELIRRDDRALEDRVAACEKRMRQRVLERTRRVLQGNLEAVRGLS
jgi:hypothetical protein